MNISWIYVPWLQKTNDPFLSLSSKLNAIKTMSGFGVTLLKRMVCYLVQRRTWDLCCDDGNPDKLRSLEIQEIIFKNAPPAV